MSRSHSLTRPCSSAQMSLMVRIGDKLYAIPITAIEEVLPALPVEPLPGCSEFVRGVVFARGHLIPVIDAARRLGTENHQRPPEPPIVCLRQGDRLIGVEVDEALDLVDLECGVRLAAGELGPREEFFTEIVEFDGKIIRLCDPAAFRVEEQIAGSAEVLSTT